MAIASAGYAAYEAYGRRQDAEAFLKVNQISQRLLQSAGQWAVERGMTNAPLKSPDALPAERRAEIVKTRAVADQAFREAAQRLRAVPADESRRKADRRSRKRVQGIRGFPQQGRRQPRQARIGTDIGGRGGLRARDHQSDRTCRQQVAADAGDADQPADGGADAARRSSSSDRANGRECRQGARVPRWHHRRARQDSPRTSMRMVARIRGQVELAWETITASRQRGDIPAKIVDAIARRRQDSTSSTYGEIRDGIFAAGETGEYKITGSDYVERAHDRDQFDPSARRCDRQRGRPGSHQRSSEEHVQA